MCSAFGVGQTGVPLADVPTASGRAGRQVRLLIMGKQPQACAHRPPGARAGGRPKREGPRSLHSGYREPLGWGRGVM